MRRRAANHAKIAIGAFAVAVQVHNRTPRARALRDVSARVVFPRQFWTIQMQPSSKSIESSTCAGFADRKLFGARLQIQCRGGNWSESLDLGAHAPAAVHPCGSLMGNCRCDCAACVGSLHAAISSIKPAGPIPSDRKSMIVDGCHCRWCQRQAGTLHALNALYEANRVMRGAGTPEMIADSSLVQTGCGGFV